MDQAAGHRGNWFQHTLFNIADVPHRLYGMFINCIAVIHIELHHPDNTPEIRQIFAQPSGFIHQPKPVQDYAGQSGWPENVHVFLATEGQPWSAHAQPGKAAQRVGMDIKLMNLGQIKQLNNQISIIAKPQFIWKMKTFTFKAKGFDIWTLRKTRYPEFT